MKPKTMKSFIIMFVLISGFFSIPITQGATGTTLITDWDEFLVGVTSGSNSMMLWSKTDGRAFDIEGSGEPDGDRYLQIMKYTGMSSGQSSTGYFQLNTNGNGFKLNCTGRAEYSSADGICYALFTFKNTTGNSVVQIRFYTRNEYTYLQYKDYTSSFNTLAFGSDQKEYSISWNYYSDNTIQYIAYNNTGGQIGIANNTGLLSGDEFTSEQQFMCNNVSVTGSATKWGKNKWTNCNAFYFFSSDFQEESEYGDVNQYEQLCEGGIGSYLNIDKNNKYVENKYDIPVSLTIKAVDLYVSSYQYSSISSSKSDYSLEVNNVPCGNPTYFFDDGLGYTLRWYDLTIALSDEKPVFEFKCNEKSVLNEYWRIAVNTEGGNFKYHNSDSLFGNGIYDGGNSWNFGLGMCFYYDSRVESDLEYDDIIHAVPTGKTQFYEYDTITFQYTVSEYYDTYLQLWHDADDNGSFESEYNTGDFGDGGYNVKTFAGTTSFIPKQTHDGDWQINIIRSGVNVTSFNFTVSNLSQDTDYNGQLWTSPKNTQVNQDFNIGWLYNKTYYDNYDGIIIFTKEQNLDGEKWIIKDGIKTSNEIGMSYSIPFQGIYYIWLCVNEGNNDYVAIDQTVQYVGMNTYNNYITTDKDHYELKFTERSSIAQSYVTIGYSHMFLGGDVYIVFGNSSMSPYFIGNSPQGELEVNYVNAGLYSVKLVYYTSSNEYEVLDEKIFSVGDTFFQEDDTVSETDDIASLLDQSFDEDFQFFFGIIIISFLVFLPLYASFVWGTGLNTFQGMFKTQKEIDGIVYTLLGIIGLAIDIYLELFELWTLVLFVFAFTMIIAWQVSNKIGGNGE